MFRKLLLFFTATLLFSSAMALPGRARADAADLTGQCAFKMSSNANQAKRATDGNLSTVWRSAAKAGQAVDITVRDGPAPGWLYLRWDASPKGWTLLALDDGGSSAVALEGGGQGYLAETIEIPEEMRAYRRFRLSSPGEAGMAIAELSVYAQGDKPFYAPAWQPPEGRADILVISAHPDDDVLYLGAVIPTYAQQGKSAVTVYMTTGKPLRRFEAMEGAWIGGGRIHPVFGPFPDSYNSKNLGDMAPQKRNWPKEKVLAFLVEQIRKYRPAVVVTHDPKGEYGHGAHKWTSELTQEAFELAGDAARFPDTAERYGAWNTAKLYLHLYKKNALTLDTRAPLDAFGGKTAFDVAKLAYTRHKSQHVFSFMVSETKHSIRQFGLAATRVGPDESHTDMFEHVSLETMLTLNPWYNYEVVDRTVLNAAITRASGLDPAAYTPESWAEADIPAALGSARAVLNKKEAAQAEVDAAAAAIDAAAAGLKEARRLASITIERLPLRRVYLVGQKLDLAGVVVKGVYNDGTEETLLVAAEHASGFDSSAPAAGQEVTITVDGQSAAFAVEILDWRDLLRNLMRLFGFVRG